MPECRICLESGEDGDLISPCNCRGSTQWVHTECLNEWRNSDINSRNRTQCEICLFNYIISSTEKKEKFIISLYKIRCHFFDFFISMLITFIFGNIIMFIDYNYKYKSIQFFNLDHLNNKSHIEDDVWFLWSYYQGFASFILNILFFSLFNITCIFKVIRKKKYFNKMRIMNLGCVFYTLNFLCIIYISKLIHSSKFFGFWSPLFVSFHFSVSIKYIKKHNKTLQNINDSLPMEVISSFQLNPLNDIIPLTISEYVIDEVI
jgi:hypothetical protein